MKKFVIDEHDNNKGSLVHYFSVLENYGDVSVVRDYSGRTALYDKKTKRFLTPYLETTWHHVGQSLLFADVNGVGYLYDYWQDGDRYFSFNYLLYF